MSPPIDLIFRHISNRLRKIDDLSPYVTLSPKGRVATIHSEELFEEISKRWRKETRYSSSDSILIVVSYNLTPYTYKIRKANQV